MKASVQQLFNATTANCWIKSKSDRNYTGRKTDPYLPMMVMDHLMTSFGYSDFDVQLEINVNDYSLEKIRDSFADRIDDPEDSLPVKIKLAKNYLKLNHGIKIK